MFKDSLEVVITTALGSTLSGTGKDVLNIAGIGICECDAKKSGG